jgi:hypothetical protein
MRKAPVVCHIMVELWNLAGEIEESHEKFQLVQLIFRLRFKYKTSRIRSRNENYYMDIF